MSNLLTYVSPEVEVVTIAQEALICQSGDGDIDDLGEGKFGW